MANIFPQHRTEATEAAPADERLLRLHATYIARVLAAGRSVIDLTPDPASQALLAEIAASVATTLTAEADLLIAWDVLAEPGDPSARLAALRRHIRPGGALLTCLDTVPAQGAAHTFTEQEAAALLSAHFPHIAIGAQLGLIGSAVEAAGPPVLFVHRGAAEVEQAATCRTPARYLLLAADTPCALPRSLLAADPLSLLASLEAEARTEAADAAALRAAHAALAAEAAAAARAHAPLRHRTAEARVAAAAAEARATAADAARAAAEQTALRLASRLAEPPPAPSPPPARPSLLHRLRRKLGPIGTGQRLAAIRASEKFDAAWYRAQNPDVAAAGIDPALHYLRHGAAEARDPGPGFDAAWYKTQHTDIPPTLTPVEHYEQQGRARAWPTQPPAPVKPPNPKILFIAGEPDTPGAQYRCVRPAEAARQAGFSAGWARLDAVTAEDLIGVDIAILWRVQLSQHVANILHELRQQNGLVVFDVDDLMIRPELANTRTIDGIRTTAAGISSTRETFAAVQQAMLAADLCTTTTEELAAHMRAFQKATWVIPNGYDSATLAAARRAVRARATTANDGLVRIGYAAGTITHQRDFAVCLPGLLKVLAARAHTRLVLFRKANGPEMVVADEYETLAPFAGRIEWRDTVPLEHLPAELARFDINLAPLEAGNPFCEAKSELKIFEAALADVPTIASPTGPFARLIRHGHNGLLATTDEEWHDALLRLTDDTALRRRLGRQAFLDCLYPFGPDRRRRAITSFLHQAKGGEAGATAFALETHLAALPARPVTLHDAETLFHADRGADAAVTIVIPCYNYADFVLEALESAHAQTLDPLDLVIVDDASTDPMIPDLLQAWLKDRASRFNRALYLRHQNNAGLSAARNTGFAAAETPHVLPLDADNRLRPPAAEKLLAALTRNGCDFAYASVQMFGADDKVFCNEPYRPTRLVGGNYIDAMALIAKSAWAAAGGYAMPRTMGWEDFDLWCAFAERGFSGVHVNEILAEYRVHGNSMLDTLVETTSQKTRMVEALESRHPWLRLSSRTAHTRI